MARWGTFSPCINFGLILPVVLPFLVCVQTLLLLALVWNESHSAKGALLAFFAALITVLSAGPTLGTLFIRHLGRMAGGTLRARLDYFKGATATVVFLLFFVHTPVTIIVLSVSTSSVLSAIIHMVTAIAIATYALLLAFAYLAPVPAPPEGKNYATNMQVELGNALVGEEYDLLPAHDIEALYEASGIQDFHKYHRMLVLCCIRARQEGLLPDELFELLRLIASEELERLKVARDSGDPAALGNMVSRIVDERAHAQAVHGAMRGQPPPPGGAWGA